jgi:hypothetical protein
VKIVCPHTGKQVYGTARRARICAARISTREGRPYRPYRCPFCHWWHLTSRSAGRKAS